ncbi:MAG TPA: hypothetical protein PK668_08700 [Myxococcota bacterium]|nr:hypothetical protein [Myxococcota bacterium]HRY92943.1 hypothetical protein [Myxococcota bacterium]
MKTKGLVCASVALLLAATSSKAYQLSTHSWCVDDCVPSFSIDLTSFTSRGFFSDVIDQLRDAAPGWNHMQEDLCIGYANNTSASCYGDNTICARYEYEDSVFDDDPGVVAYNTLHYGLDIDCAPDLGNLWYYQVYNATYPFGMTAQAAHTYGSFVNTASHEFGHSMSLGDFPGANGPNALMSYDAERIFHSDDANGLVNRYGVRAQGIKSRLGYGVNYTTGALNTFSSITQWSATDYKTGVRPSIVGNWHQGIGGSYGWDYAAAWVVGTTIKVALLKDNTDGSLQVRSMLSLPCGQTRFSPSIAVGDSNQILVVWKNSGTSNILATARLQAATDGSSLTYLECEGLSPYQPLSEPVVTFMPGRYRYVISWVMDGSTGTNSRHRIAAMVSTNTAGTNWNAPYTYEGSDPTFPEFVTSPWHAPALTCYNGLVLTSTCLMMYKQFRTADTRWIDQQAFGMTADNTHLVTSATDWSTWNESHAEMAIASSLYDWLFTHVQNNGAKSYMQYRVKRFSQGVGGHYRNYGTHSRADMVSRVGFPVAYNYRTDRFRFFWIER